MGRARRSTLILAATVGVGVIAATPASAAVAPAPGVVYAAEIARQNTVVAEVTPTRTRVTKFAFTWDAQCVLSPTAPPTTGTFVAFTEPNRGPIVIRKNGLWVKRSFTTGPFTDPVTGNAERFAYTITGKRVGATMRGTLRVIMTETDTAGQIVRTCDSGALKFNLIDKDVFAGLTSQRNPIIVKMNPARTKVTRLRWDWEDVSCTPGPGATPETPTGIYFPDFFTDFAVKKATGAWGATIDTPPIPDDPPSANSTSYDYKIVGRRIGNVMRGTITAGFTETVTATGVVIRECSSGPVKFNIKN